MYLLKEEFLIFTITKYPLYGSIEHLTDGSWEPVTVFSMTEIYGNQISYLHNGGEATQDNFWFSVSDGRNDRFSVRKGNDARETIVPQTQAQVKN